MNIDVKWIHNLIKPNPPLWIFFHSLSPSLDLVFAHFMLSPQFGYEFSYIGLNMEVFGNMGYVGYELGKVRVTIFTLHGNELNG